MSKFTLIAKDLNVAPLLAQLDGHPEVWDTRPERRAGNSPHRETSDVWVRYAKEAEMQKPDFAHKPHQSVWWPAIIALPAVLDLVSDVRRALGGPVELGGILITRIESGKQVYPHHDRGTFHAEYYTTKVWVVLCGNDRCVNTVEDEEMVWKPGEAWSHDNLRVHSVRNDGDSERIVLILCFRRN